MPLSIIDNYELARAKVIELKELFLELDDDLQESIRNLLYQMIKQNATKTN